MKFLDYLIKLIQKSPQSESSESKNKIKIHEEEVILTPNDLIGIDVLIKHFLITIGHFKKVELIKNELSHIEPEMNLINNPKIPSISFLYSFDLDDYEKENISHFGARAVPTSEHKDIDNYPPRKRNNEELTSILIQEFNIYKDTSNPMMQVKTEIEDMMTALIIKKRPDYKTWIYNSFWSIFLSNILIKFEENQVDNSYFITFTFIFR